MPGVSLIDLVVTLRDGRLLDAAQLDEVTDNLVRKLYQPPALVEELVRRGWLTTFQGGQLLLGRGRDLLLGPYLLLEPLGEDSLGTLYKAQVGLKKRLAALQVFRPELLADAAERARLERVARAAVLLPHPHLVALDNVFQFERAYFWASEYVAGVGLPAALEERGPMSVIEACRYLRQAALGVEHLHRHGIVHRSLAPTKLVRTPDDVLKVRDLSKAWLPDAEAPGPRPVLTVADFTAPEQLQADAAVDGRADLFSLGGVLFYLLTGRGPFAGGQASGDPPPIQRIRPDVPDLLAKALARLLTRRPEDRLPTVAELLQVLNHVLEPRPAVVTPPPEPPSERPNLTSSVEEATLDSGVPPPPEKPSRRVPAAQRIGPAPARPPEPDEQGLLAEEVASSEVGPAFSVGADALKAEVPPRQAEPARPSSGSLAPEEMRSFLARNPLPKEPPKPRLKKISPHLEPASTNVNIDLEAEAKRPPPARGPSSAEFANLPPAPAALPARPPTPEVSPAAAAPPSAASGPQAAPDFSLPPAPRPGAPARPAPPLQAGLEDAPGALPRPSPPAQPPRPVASALSPPPAPPAPLLRKPGPPLPNEVVVDDEQDEIEERPATAARSGRKPKAESRRPALRQDVPPSRRNVPDWRGERGGSSVVRSLWGRLTGLFSSTTRLTTPTPNGPPVTVWRHTDVSFPAMARAGKLCNLRIQIVPAEDVLASGEVRPRPRPHPHDAALALQLPPARPGQPPPEVRVTVTVAAENFFIEGDPRAEIVVPLDGKSSPAVFRLRGEAVGRGRVMIDFSQLGRPVGSVDLACQLVGADQPAQEGDAHGTAPVGLAFNPGAAPDVVLTVYEYRHASGPGQLHFVLSSTHPGLRDLPVLQGDLGTMDLHGDVAEWVEGQLRCLATLAEQGDVSPDVVARTLADVGCNLFEQLLPRPLQDLYWTLRERGVQTMLVLSDEPHIPWELIKPFRQDRATGMMQEEDPFWGESFALTHWLRGRPPAPRLALGRVFAVAAGLDGSPSRSRVTRNVGVSGPGATSVTALPAALAEVEAIQGLTAVGATVLPLSARRYVLKEALEKGDFDVLHLVCHGQFGGWSAADSSIVLLEDGPFSATELSPRMVGAMQRSSPLIFFNSCSSGRLGFSLTRLGSWGARLVQLGCGGFIGSLWPVTDRAALAFVQAFYAGLAGGMPIGRAMRQARGKVREQFPNDPTWLAYRCFADPMACVEKPLAK